LLSLGLGGVHLGVDLRARPDPFTALKRGIQNRSHVMVLHPAEVGQVVVGNRSLGAEVSVPYLQQDRTLEWRETPGQPVNVGGACLVFCHVFLG
jgi:hypothetical protein